MHMNDKMFFMTLAIGSIIGGLIGFGSNGTLQNASFGAGLGAIIKVFLIALGSSGSKA